MHVGKIPPFMGMMFDNVRNAPKEVVESDADLKAFQSYLLDPNEHYSYFDGGQLMYVVDIAGHGRIAYSSHTGCYSSILKGMQPKPDVAILGVPARPNLDGYPYQGTNAQFLLEEVQWLKPKKVLIPTDSGGWLGGCVLFEGCASREAVWGEDWGGGKVDSWKDGREGD
jgi:hypothetical protein